ncbi:hypothetical protein ABZ757_35965, partial [Streptomyces albidoflavus]
RRWRAARRCPKPGAGSQHGTPGGGIAAEPQHIDAPLSTAAAFLVLVVKDGEEVAATARSVVASTDPEDRGAKHTAVAPLRATCCTTCAPPPPT